MKKTQISQIPSEEIESNNTISTHPIRPKTGKRLFRNKIKDDLFEAEISNYKAKQKLLLDNIKKMIKVYNKCIIISKEISQPKSFEDIELVVSYFVINYQCLVNYTIAANMKQFHAVSVRSTNWPGRWTVICKLRAYPTAVSQKRDLVKDHGARPGRPVGEPWTQDACGRKLVLRSAAAQRDVNVKVPRALDAAGGGQGQVEIGKIFGCARDDNLFGRTCMLIIVNNILYRQHSFCCDSN